MKTDILECREVWIPKSKMMKPPSGFELTSMGDQKDALAQYRGPDNLHLLEYKDGWMMHQDYGDPRSLGGFIVHIFLDAPEVGVSLIAATTTAQERYNETKSVLEAVGAFLSTAGAMYISMRIVKETLSRIADWLNGCREDTQS